MDVLLLPDSNRLLQLQDLDADETDQTLKATAGVIVEIDVANIHATEWMYLKLYNSDGAVTIATAVPDYSYALEPASSRTIHLIRPLHFALGIHYAVTTERGLGNSAPATAPNVQFRYL